LLRKNTPASLILFFREHRIFKERSSFQRINYLLKQMDQLSLFLVGPMEVSLRQHFSLGFCEKKCYFCALRQPIKLHYPASSIDKNFPVLGRLIALSNDLRTM
jgi:coproporphyrinogen III oxidase-like Fe-S oxidoreductase